jgi:hypothetical protein
MIRRTGMWCIVGLLTIATGLLAQEQLPKKLEGIWNGVGHLGSRKGHIGGSLAVVIEKQNPDGSVEGKITHSGGRSCEMNDEPMIGRFDGNVLTMQATFRNRYPNAGCESVTWVLKKGKDNTFEGEIPGNINQMKAKLAPR